MKILTCTAYRYYNDPGAIASEFLPFTEIPRQMGHTVHFIDHIDQAMINKEIFNDFFLSVVKNGKYDLVFIQLSQDEFYPETLDEARKHTLLVAWNSDDDWRWNDYSKKWYSHFDKMVTTYRHIYETNKKEFPNLILSRWACGGFYNGLKKQKDIDLCFVGQIYGNRARDIQYINKKVPIIVFGRGTMATQLPLKKKIKRWGAKILRIPFEPNILAGPKEINDIWNRSKVSYTPLRASRGNGLQIKARVFEMGLSGTVMLCDRNPMLDEFYERGKEYLDFEDIDECIEKVRFLLANENNRKKIAEAYYERTKKEHLWRHRFEKLFKELGFK